MKGLGQTGALEQKYEQPYFIGSEPLKLPSALPDVTGDAKKRETAEAFMKPLTVNVKIPSRLVDNHFGQDNAKKESTGTNSKEFTLLDTSKTIDNKISINSAHEKTKLQSKFWQMCNEGNVEKMHELISKQVNYNLADSQGWTPLLLTIRSHKDEAVKLLLDQEDININGCNSKNINALSLACQLKAKDITNLLMAVTPLPALQLEIIIETGSDGIIKPILVKYLNERRFAVDELYGVKLMLLIRQKLTLSCKFIIEKMRDLAPSSINQTNRNGETALILSFICSWLIFKTGYSKLFWQFSNEIFKSIKDI